VPGPTGQLEDIHLQRFRQVESSEDLSSPFTQYVPEFGAEQVLVRPGSSHLMRGGPRAKLSLDSGAGYSETSVASVDTSTGTGIANTTVTSCSTTARITLFDKYCILRQIRTKSRSKLMREEEISRGTGGDSYIPSSRRWAKDSLENPISDKGDGGVLCYVEQG
jgi:hypothetical protein